MKKASTLLCKVERATESEKYTWTQVSTSTPSSLFHLLTRCRTKDQEIAIYTAYPIKSLHSPNYPLALSHSKKSANFISTSVEKRRKMM
mmetsp:Transcript_7370/g.14452  ORF Transcript_7370/g.14452 Transcript_7370/m.14452 type:complete len:89 (+) Transcript_7370:743-1009(+)